MLRRTVLIRIEKPFSSIFHHHNFHRKRKTFSTTNNKLNQNIPSFQFPLCLFLQTTKRNDEKKINKIVKKKLIFYKFVFNFVILMNHSAVNFAYAQYIRNISASPFSLFIRLVRFLSILSTTSVIKL